MLLPLLISGAVSVFLIVAMLILMLGGKETIDVRLMEISASAAESAPTFTNGPTGGVARMAAGINGIFKPLRSLISGSDADLAYRLNAAGFRKSDYVEIYPAIKILLPIIGIAAGSFFGSNLFTAILIGATTGFFAPDLVLSHLVSRRREAIRRALPDAFDLLVICMEAGLGIDQAMVRVGDEIRLTSPALADEFQIINREQRAGKPRLDAWRSMAERIDIDFLRQFVSMLSQTERFGTPMAHSLGQFADMLRMRRTQAAEEVAAKTGIKLLFPLVLFIFPSIFVVSLGPAILSIQKMLSELAK
jgi:tight adherence protein C